MAVAVAALVHALQGRLDIGEDHAGRRGELDAHLGLGGGPPVEQCLGAGYGRGRELLDLFAAEQALLVETVAQRGEVRGRQGRAAFAFADGLLVHHFTPRAVRETESPGGGRQTASRRQGTQNRV